MYSITCDLWSCMKLSSTLSEAFKHLESTISPFKKKLPIWPLMHPSVLWRQTKKNTSKPFCFVFFVVFFKLTMLIRMFASLQRIKDKINEEQFLFGRTVSSKGRHSSTQKNLFAQKNIHSIINTLKACLDFNGLCYFVHQMSERESQTGLPTGVGDRTHDYSYLGVTLLPIANEN